MLPPDRDVLRGFARRMREAPTPAERKLWLLLRSRRFAGYKFRRQAPLGPYILDFICFERRLIIEADGSQHVENGSDVRRDRWLEAEGFRVRRFWNADVLLRPCEVGDTIWADLEAGRFTDE